jgi:hypothetical protein
VREIHGKLRSKLPKTWAGSTGRCNTGLQFTRRSFKAQGFSRALIRKHDVAIADGRVGNSGEVEGRFGVGKIPVNRFPFHASTLHTTKRIRSFQIQPIPRFKWAKTESEGIINSLGVRSLRFEQLDSMRGLAALVVVFHHFYLMFYRAHFRSNPWSALIYPFVAGHESVMLFFVLSGFVLSLPLMKQVPFSYPIYVWKRVLRIYGPYLGALAITIIGCAIWHNRLPSFAGGVPPWNGPVTLQGVSHVLVFIGPGNDTRYNETFWSLIHEMRISIVFPVIFVFIGAIGIAGAALAILFAL